MASIPEQTSSAMTNGIDSIIGIKLSALSVKELVKTINDVFSSDDFTKLNENLKDTISNMMDGFSKEDTSIADLLASDTTNKVTTRMISFILNIVESQLSSKQS